QLFLQRPTPPVPGELVARVQIVEPWENHGELMSVNGFDRLPACPWPTNPWQVGVGMDSRAGGDGDACSAVHGIHLLELTLPIRFIILDNAKRIGPKVAKA